MPIDGPQKLGNIIDVIVGFAVLFQNNNQDMAVGGNMLHNVLNYTTTKKNDTFDLSYLHPFKLIPVGVTSSMRFAKTVAHLVMRESCSILTQPVDTRN